MSDDFYGFLTPENDKQLPPNQFRGLPDSRLDQESLWNHTQVTGSSFNKSNAKDKELLGCSQGEM